MVCKITFEKEMISWREKEKKKKEMNLKTLFKTQLKFMLLDLIFLLNRYSYTQNRSHQFLIMYPSVLKNFFLIDKMWSVWIFFFHVLNFVTTLQIILVFLEIGNGTWPIWPSSKVQVFSLGSFEKITKILKQSNSFFNNFFSLIGPGIMDQKSAKFSNLGLICGFKVPEFLGIWNPGLQNLKRSFQDYI